MKKVALRVSYDGTAYVGWQRQNNGMSIQQALEEALENLTGEAIAVEGASRTDAGVHALGNEAVFYTESPIPARAFAPALNRRLPEDIRIRQSWEAPAAWHPRYDYDSKAYMYRWGLDPLPPTKRLYAQGLRRPLDIPAMEAAAVHLIGERDFAAFCAAGAQVRSTVRRVEGIRMAESGPYWAMAVWGNGFLYNMVRIMAGTLMEVGWGRRKPEDMQALLESRDRRLAGPTAPARGLILLGYGWEDMENRQDIWDCC